MRREFGWFRAQVYFEAFGIDPKIAWVPSIRAQTDMAKQRRVVLELLPHSHEETTVPTFALLVILLAMPRLQADGTRRGFRHRTLLFYKVHAEFKV
jgi:hypothetical protein